MSKPIYDYLNKKSRSYWFYFHLKHDSAFQKEAAELDQQLTIKLDDGSDYHPTMVEDFGYLDDPDKDTKLEAIMKFQARWNIHWDYFLLSYLIRGNPEDVPPAGNGSVALGFNEERNMFEAQIPLSAQKEDLEILWRLMQGWKKDLGIDISKKPRKYTFTQRKTEIAFVMWKMLRDKKSWTDVVKAIDAEFDHHFEDISTAKKFLKANGYS